MLNFQLLSTDLLLKGHFAGVRNYQATVEYGEDCQEKSVGVRALCMCPKAHAGKDEGCMCD